MNIKYYIVSEMLFIAISSVFSQNENTSLVHSVSITSSQIYFVDTVIVGYKFGNTRVYPPQKIPIRKLLYSCKLTIKLNGESFIIEEPFVVKCFLPNNSFQKVVLNNERYIMTSDQFYDFNFEFYSENKLIGWTTLELDRDKSSEDDGIQKEKNIRYDKTTFFIK